MRMRRSGILGAALAAPAAITSAWVQGLDFPTRSVRLVVAYPLGGSTNVVGRLLAECLGRAWGQPVIVENRPGAAGTLGADVVAKAVPDGYTLLVGASSEMAVVHTGIQPE